jgi:hypothetical protein
MIRIGSIIILFITVFLMIRGISVTWNNKPVSEPIEAGTQLDPGAVLVPEDLVVNPQVPTIIPQFKQGYLFNEARLLEEEKEEGPKPEEENLAGNDLGIKTDINSVIFSGSIITDTFRWAIVTYSTAPPPKAKAAGKKSRSSRRKKRTTAKTTTETTKLMEGDLLSGYKVAAIDPDKIVFSKGEEIVEKFIYDPNKKRAKPAASSRAAKVPAKPRPGAAGAPPVPPAPMAPKSVNAPGAKKTTTAKRPTTARRLVVSRKPPPKPDTSRVSRRRRAGGSSVGAPPGGPGAPPMLKR